MFKQLSIAAAALLLAGAVFAQAKGLADSYTEPEATADLWVEAGKGGYSVEFINDGAVAGMQFDIKDASIQEGGFTCSGTLSSAFQTSCVLNAEQGYLRVLVFSMDASIIPDATVVSVRRTSGGAASFKAIQARPSLNGVVLSDNQGRNVTPDHLD